MSFNLCVCDTYTDRKGREKLLSKEKQSQFVIVYANNKVELHDRGEKMSIKIKYRNNSLFHFRYLFLYNLPFFSISYCILINDIQIF